MFSIEAERDKLEATAGDGEKPNAFSVGGVPSADGTTAMGGGAEIGAASLGEEEEEEAA